MAPLGVVQSDTVLSYDEGDELVIDNELADPVAAVATGHGESPLTLQRDNEESLVANPSSMAWSSFGG